MTVIVVIPARLASTRLPNKPLADIGGVPMIVHVWRRAVEAQVGPVVVAAADTEIAEAVTAAGGEAVLTRQDLPSGTDRAFEALRIVDADGSAKAVINLQGDLPSLDPALVRDLADRLATSRADIVTLAAEIRDEQERSDPHVVKPVVTFAADPPDVGDWGRALYFTRASAPTGPGPLYHHIGLYGFRREALERFVALPPSPLEQREKLEQLRALEAGMTIEVGLVDTVPVGVDTPSDLERARAHLSVQKQS